MSGQFEVFQKIPRFKKAFLNEALGLSGLIPLWSSANKATKFNMKQNRTEHAFECKKSFFPPVFPLSFVFMINPLLRL